MLEYAVIDLTGFTSVTDIADRLSYHARAGWHVVGVTQFIIVLEREMTPTVEEVDTPSGKQITYTWPPLS
jgi:hypothetical protein